VGPDLELKVHFAGDNLLPDAFTAEAIMVFGDGIPLGTYLDQGDLSHCKLGAFNWTVLAPDIVNLGLEEQSSASV